MCFREFVKLRHDLLGAAQIRSSNPGHQRHLTIWMFNFPSSFTTALVNSGVEVNAEMHHWLPRYFWSPSGGLTSSGVVT